MSLQDEGNHRSLKISFLYYLLNAVFWGNIMEWFPIDFSTVSHTDNSIQDVGDHGSIENFFLYYQCIAMLSWEI